MDFLWNGLFGLVAAVVGGVVTGLFMRSQQKAEFRQRANGAVRALLIELEENDLLIVKMLQRPQFERLDSPDPARLKSLVWEAQLPLIANSLQPPVVAAVVQAYRSSDSLRNSLRGVIRRADESYSIGQVQSNLIITTHDLLEQAIAAVRGGAGMPERRGS
jgi:hypothetical protein